MGSNSFGNRGRKEEKVWQCLLTCALEQRRGLGPNLGSLWSGPIGSPRLLNFPGVRSPALCWLPTLLQKVTGFPGVVHGGRDCVGQEV